MLKVSGRFRQRSDVCRIPCDLQRTFLQEGRKLLSNWVGSWKLELLFVKCSLGTPFTKYGVWNSGGLCFFSALHPKDFIFSPLGKRRYDRKQSGYGGQTKPIFRKKVSVAGKPRQCNLRLWVTSAFKK